MYGHLLCMGTRVVFTSHEEIALSEEASAFFLVKLPLIVDCTAVDTRVLLAADGYKDADLSTVNIK